MLKVIVCNFKILNLAVFTEIKYLNKSAESNTCCQKNTNMICGTVVVRYYYACTYIVHLFVVCTQKTKQNK